MTKTFLGAALSLFIAGTAIAQNKKQETLEGNGNVVTREVSVQPFTALKASGVYELKLVQGPGEGVKIEADENLQELFEVKNDGSQLVISMKEMKNKNLKTKNKMRVYVTFKTLKSMELSTVGNVTTDNTLNFDDLDLRTTSVGNVNLKLTAEKLSLENKSVGDVSLSGTASDVVVRNNGVGSLHAASFVVQTMDIDNSGVGSAEVNAEKSLKVKDSFLGKVSNKGAAPVRK
ncbi:MAG TPA: head GIN domain-containing protein, partial [Chitinophagaceae bacterium]|nr:head GIN domain-containing protein [Chitinophagaceae bacterium]